MAKSKREKELQRSRARRAEERASQGHARRRVGLVVLVLVLGAGVLGTAVALRGDDPATPAIADDQAGQAESTEAAPSEPSYLAPAGAPDAVPCDPAPGAALEPTSESYDAPPTADLGGVEEVEVVLSTTCGDIRMVLAAADAPTTVGNFVGLAEDGYYANVPFHRVIDGFMVQGGDPTGKGTGCVDEACSLRFPGYQFDDELSLAEQTVEANGGYPRGTVAMANAGPDTNGSQFFIIQAEPGYPLPPQYAVFGTVTEGMDVVDRIAQGPTVAPGSDAAADPVRIVSVDVVG